MKITKKRVGTLFAAGMAVALVAWAQDARPNRVTIPFNDPARPKTLQVRLMMGSIHVQGYDGNDAVIEGLNAEGRKNPAPEIDGLRRVDFGGVGLRAEQTDNVVTVTERGFPRSNQLSIQVPVATALKVRAMSSDEVTVERISGDVEINLTHGAVTAMHLTGTADVHTLDGKIRVALDRIAADKPVSLSSLKGDIDLTLPADAKVSLKMKSHDGAVYSDFDITPLPSASTPAPEPGKGTGKGSGKSKDASKYRIQFDSTMRGLINGGGPEIQLTTFHGNIFVRKAK